MQLAKVSLTIYFFCNTISFLASGNCLNVTSLSDVDGSVLRDDRNTTCITIQNVRGVTQLLDIQLMSGCRNKVENNQVRFGMVFKRSLIK